MKLVFAFLLFSLFFFTISFLIFNVLKKDKYKFVYGVLFFFNKIFFFYSYEIKFYCVKITRWGFCYQQTFFLLYLKTTNKTKIMFLNFSTANLKITRLNLKRSVFLHLKTGGKTWNDCLAKLDLYECKSGKVLVLNNVPFQVCQLCFKSLSLFLLILIVFRYLHAFLT